MRWNTPLSEEHAALLLKRLEIRPQARVVDLGCGWGELLTRAVAAGGAECQGVGVDTDSALLARGRALAAEKGLADRIEFLNQEAGGWKQPADRLLCVGASHAWGDIQTALMALTEVVRPGGRVLFGDGCWTRAPDSAGGAWALFGDSVRELDEIVGAAQTAGWRVIHLSTADQREWDEFESTCVRAARSGCSPTRITNRRGPFDPSSTRG